MVDVELQQHRRRVGGPDSDLGLNTPESQARNIQFINEHVNHPDVVVTCDVIINSFRESTTLISVFCSFNGK